MIERAIEETPVQQKPVDETDGEQTKPLGARARVRAQLTAEIKASARRQLAVDGASALSLRAIAREMGMASSAIYRYFASRDELLTALIVDAYDSIGCAAESAAAAVDRADHAARFVAIAIAIRNWAHANPEEYALIYGSPVPGYSAPDATIDPATRVSVALLDVLVDAHTGELANTNPVDEHLVDGRRGRENSGRETTGDQNASLAASLAELSAFVDHRVSASVLARGVRAWGELFGLVSLELFGHFNNAISDPAAFYAHAVSDLAERTLQP